MKTLTINEARDLVAKNEGYESWEAFINTNWVDLGLPKILPKILDLYDRAVIIFQQANAQPPLVSSYDGTLMEPVKTLREVRDFLNAADDQYLDRNFYLQRENEIHYIHYMEINDEDLFYDPEDPELGCMSMSDWQEDTAEVDPTTLLIGIPKGVPMFNEQF
jgi:hypothetical protein